MPGKCGKHMIRGISDPERQAFSKQVDELVDLENATGKDFATRGPMQSGRKAIRGRRAR